MHTYTVVNSFGLEPFTGNPVAVFFDCDGLSAESMQSLAAELKLSETTFISSPRRGGHANVRIFTPVNELGFAGHPLLGTALALANEVGLTELDIETKKGTFLFSVRPLPSLPRAAYVHMEQPTPSISAYEHQAALLSALGVERSTLPVDVYDVGPRHVFVGVETATELSELSPDHGRLSRLGNMAALCFSPDGDAGWRLRMFSPAYGVVEDAATGSAAGPFALHLARYGLAPLGETIEITQGVEMRRPSRMRGVARSVKGAIRLEAGGYGYQAAVGRYFI